MTDTTEAGRELLHAGAAAYRRGEVAEALRIFEHAARTGSPGVRVSALVNAASMRDELGDHAGAAAGYRAALQEIPSTAVEKRASALINYSQSLQHLGALDEAQGALEQARALLAADEFPALRVPCLLSLTAVAFHRGQWARVIELGTESLDVAARFAPELSGHPLMNLAGAYFETGRRELGVDFARQALAAFEAAGDRNAVAETRQNLAQLLCRLDRLDEAETPLSVSQEYFERAGLGYRAGVGLRTMGFLAERRGDDDGAARQYLRALAYFEESGAVLDAAGVRTRLATVAFGRRDTARGRELLDAAFAAYASRGLGLHCAQVDYWHAVLLERLVDGMGAPSPELVATGRALVVPAAIAIDAVRYTLPNGNQREQWNREIADPAMRLAFRFAALCGDGPLVADLIETQCAGTTLDMPRTTAPVTPRYPLVAPRPPTDLPANDAAGLHLGSALAQIAAAAGLPVTLPPRLAVAPDGRIALAEYLAAAEHRYGLTVRTDQVLPV
ncbi:tetratricopeptide repeat protein [Nocardia brevicatena]|uniref:tetratricopeptide repeat protein n=1 Tax=Nocardia brevicatena TaxID=37327 RepID=UPI0002DFD4AC|nr:tetratricopeptide repeat protein [Nocardia brevicatena]